MSKIKSYEKGKWHQNMSQQIISSQFQQREISLSVQTQQERNRSDLGCIPFFPQVSSAPANVWMIHRSAIFRSPTIGSYYPTISFYFPMSFLRKLSDESCRGMLLTLGTVADVTVLFPPIFTIYSVTRLITGVLPRDVVMFGKIWTCDHSSELLRMNWKKPFRMDHRRGYPNRPLRRTANRLMADDWLDFQVASALGFFLKTQLLS